MILVLTDHITPRLQYILRELLTGRLGMEFQLVSDPVEFEVFKGPKLNYTHKELPAALSIKPVSLLFEEGVSNQAIEVTDEQWWKKVFFRGAGDIPFDLFAASFFLLSRYEEYLPHVQDEHGRFPSSESVAGKHGFIEWPLVDTWCLQLGWELEHRFGPVQKADKKFDVLSTIDIDLAYKYNGIGWVRHLMKSAKALLSFRWNDWIEQLQVLAGFRRDPYDTYDWIGEVCRNNGIDLAYFLLMKGGTAYDKNIQSGSFDMQHLIRKLRSDYEIGLHPSYYSPGERTLLEEEKQRLESFLGREVEKSRQHYLKASFPATFQVLAEVGIRQDHTLGYPDLCGFRASTCHPFFFFDLQSNAQSGLVLFPPCVMDVTLKNYMGLDPESALRKTEQLMNEVKKVNGIFISIWHNSNLSEREGWKGWREVFEKMHILASGKEQKID